MSEYCNKCSKEMYRLGDSVIPDVDVYQIAAELQNGCFQKVMCEGCEMLGVSKDIKGNIFLMYPDRGIDGEEVKKIPIKKWEESSQFLLGEVTEVNFLGGILIDSTGYRLKIIKGLIVKDIQMYHVIQEYLGDLEVAGYALHDDLNQNQILEKHKINVVEIFSKMERQNIFKT